MSLNSLIEKAKSFDIPQDQYESIEKGRLEFIRKFPQENINNLTIDEYVQGTDGNSFCYWLEFKKILFGIGGGNASKFGFYKSTNSQYYSGAGKNKKLLSNDDLIRLFNSIKAGIIQALKYTEQDNISEIKSLKVPMWNMVLQKILSIYYPEKFITIGAPDVLIECARDIKIERVDLIPENSIQINYDCKRKLSSIEPFKDWNYDKLGTFIWEIYSEDSKRDYFIIGSKYSGKAVRDVFPQMLEKSVISTGFAPKLNLKEYFGGKTSDISDFLKRNGENENSINALKHFLTLKVGDRIAIKSSGSPKGGEGFLSIIGIAEVIEKAGIIYSHEPDGLGHLVNVKFLQAPVYKEFKLGGFGRTIHKLSNSEHIQMIFKSDYELVPLEQLQKIPIEARVIYAFLKSSLSHREIQEQILNKAAPSRGGGFAAMEILYNYEINGEKKGILNSVSLNSEIKTATGKYLEALNILKLYYPELIDSEGKTKPISYPLNTIFYGPPGTGKTYYTIIRASEIVENRKMATFSEALKVFKDNLDNRIEFITFHQNYSYEDFIQGLRPDTENNSNLIFERRDGIFKIIADRALKNIQDHYKPGLIKRSFDDVFNTFFSPLIEGEKEEVEIAMKKVSYYVTGISNKSIEFRKSSGASNNSLSIATLRKMYESETLLDIQGLSPYYSPLLTKLLELGKDPEGKKEITSLKNFVIVIDEINRANISRVFGELITQIEPDKRSHGAIPLKCTLPSGDKFIVPSNLYIIGTMNTADKSLALLDIALRRRFEFEAMYPKYEIEGETIFNVDVLKRLNESIIKLKGYDFQIGHAYFMGENKDLIECMNKKVIPLLLEYFMNDVDDVKSILDNAGLEIEQNSWPLKIRGRRG